MGGAEYAKLGTEGSTGTKLVSVSGDVQRPGNYEIELGISSREIIFGLCGGPKDGRKVKMWFPGGSSSPVLLEQDLDLAYDFDTLAKAGSMLGSGAIIVVDDSHSALEVAQKVVKFYAHESCGKCVPCREGTNWTVRCSRGSSPARRLRWTSTSWPRCRPRSSATACACSATRWRCRSARSSRSSAASSRRRSRRHASAPTLPVLEPTEDLVAIGAH